MTVGKGVAVMMWRGHRAERGTDFGKTPISRGGYKFWEGVNFGGGIN